VAPFRLISRHADTSSGATLAAQVWVPSNTATPHACDRIVAGCLTPVFAVLALTPLPPPKTAAAELAFNLLHVPGGMLLGVLSTWAISVARLRPSRSLIAALVVGCCVLLEVTQGLIGRTASLPDALISALSASVYLGLATRRGRTRGSSPTTRRLDPFLQSS
jgi:VanZ family protein